MTAGVLELLRGISASPTPQGDRSYDEGTVEIGHLFPPERSGGAVRVDLARGQLGSGPEVAFGATPNVVGLELARGSKVGFVDELDDGTDRGGFLGQHDVGEIDLGPMSGLAGDLADELDRKARGRRARRRRRGRRRPDQLLPARRLWLEQGLERAGDWEGAGHFDRPQPSLGVLAVPALVEELSAFPVLYRVPVDDDAGELHPPVRCRGQRAESRLGELDRDGRRKRPT